MAAAFAAPAASAACADENLRPEAGNLDRVRAAVTCLHNRERKASGVAALRSNKLLDSSAGAHSADMVSRLYFEHDTPDGVDPFERMERVGYIRKRMLWNAGENIAWGSGALATPRSVFDAWMKSTGHRLTLLASDFSELGVGISLGSPSAAHSSLTGAVTYTVDFGHRQAERKRAGCARRPKCRRR